MNQSENINIDWTKVAQTIMILIITLTTIASSVFLLLFSKGMLVGAHASATIIMTTVACIIGVASVLLLRTITEKSTTSTDPLESYHKSDTVVIDHTKKTSPSLNMPKLTIPK